MSSQYYSYTNALVDLIVVSIASMHLLLLILLAFSIDIFSSLHDVTITIFRAVNFIQINCMVYDDQIHCTITYIFRSLSYLRMFINVTS